MSSPEYLPAFATNRPELNELVYSEVNRLFRVLRERLAVAPPIAIATAYVNPAGFALIADELEAAVTVRLLLGSDPDESLMLPSAAEAADRDERIRAAVSEHEAWLIAERDAMGYTRLATSQARRMVAWLEALGVDGAARVEVRRYSSGFLHGKAYIADDTVLPAVLAGSSNMTFAGLSLNAELNIGYAAGDPVHGNKVRDWFDYYWKRSEPYDLAALYSEQWSAHSPWTVFLRMLLELYQDHLDEEDDRRTVLNLTQFQSDGVARMRRLLDTLGGVLVADEVGLGKTFLAGEIIARATQEQRQQVLIVCPASLKSGMWDPFLEKYDFSRRVKVLSYEELRRRMDDPDAETFRESLEDFALVVIDEAHNLRNAGAQRSMAVDRALIGGANPKKVILLTATPVNNSLKDLETLIKYFVRDDAQFAAQGIPSIRGYIKRAQDMDPDRLTPEHLFDLMDQVAVRRTRKFVKDTYPGEVIIGPSGEEIPIQFPTPVPYRIDYDLNPAGQDLLNRVVYALDLPDDIPLAARYNERKGDLGRLMMARYTPSGYRLDSELEAFQVSNAGLLRSALLKRLESSPYALKSTLATLISAHEAFVAGLEAGYVITGQALRDVVAADSAELESVLKLMDLDVRTDVDPLAEYHADALTEDVTSDLKLLRELHQLAEAAIAAGDPKARRLIEELTAIAKQARKADASGLSEGDRRKVLVFSSFSDTIQDLHSHVAAALGTAGKSPLADYKRRLAEPVMGTSSAVLKAHQRGGVDQEHRARIIQGFAPESVGPWHPDGTPVPKDEFDLVLTTDVLAEGVNLQQAGHIINYDLPWNPMRIVQRHGRIDRIGSRHETVRLGLFFPEDNLDTLLHLQETLDRKLAQAEAAVGVGNVLPGRRAGREVVLTDTLEEIRRLHAEDPALLESRGSSAALSGEEYRRRLSTAFLDPFVKGDVERLPFGSGSGFVNPRVTGNGYVFCAKVGTHSQPWFRYVPVDESWQVLVDDLGQGLVVDDTLVSLVAADPLAPTTVREVSAVAYDGAFDAWELAKSDVLSSWRVLTDARNLMPTPPKAVREAFRLVTSSGSFLGVDEQRDLLQRLNSVPSSKVEAAIRAAVNAEGSDEKRIELLRQTVLDAGLQPAAPVKPLPPVSESEVRLVVWMAVTGAPERPSA